MYKQYIKDCDDEDCASSEEVNDCLGGENPQSYINDHLVCDGDDDDDDPEDDSIVQCAKSKAKNLTDDDGAEDCLYTLFGANATDPDVCDWDALEDQYNGDTDEENCGVNSQNSQGCEAGFYQPSDDLQGPAVACPDGYWCPDQFTCTSKSMATLCFFFRLTNQIKNTKKHVMPLPAAFHCCCLFLFFFPEKISSVPIWFAVPAERAGECRFEEVQVPP